MLIKSIRLDWNKKDHHLCQIFLISVWSSSFPIFTPHLSIKFVPSLLKYSFVWATYVYFFFTFVKFSSWVYLYIVCFVKNMQIIPTSMYDWYFIWILSNNQHYILLAMLSVPFMYRTDYYLHILTLGEMNSIQL